MGNVFNHGTVFELTSKGRFRLLHTFKKSKDGWYPRASLIMDGAGNLYGTTVEGGAHGQGVVYRIGSDRAETVLYSFKGGSDGSFPEASLITDNEGNIYGTTKYGGYGGDDFCLDGGCGTVFEISPSGTHTVSYAFLGVADGIFPQGSLVRDPQGNLYGMTGGGGFFSEGTIFRLTPEGVKTDLYDFELPSGGYPLAGLTRDTNGNLYGSAQGGDHGGGVAFEFTSVGTYTILHSFTGGADGRYLSGNLTIDRAGNLYGATPQGGDLDCQGGSGCGTIFRIKN